MIKRIAVHIDQDPACADRVAAAVALAKTHNARITGLYALDPLRSFSYDEIGIPASVLEIQRRHLIEEREKCMQRFREQASSAGVAADLLVIEGICEKVLASQARYSDILIVSQADPQDHRSSIAPYQLESVIMAAGRPVLAIPYIGGGAKPVERVLVCWDGSREAARAIADAAPFLARAREIVVLTLDKTVGPAGSGNAVDDLASYLHAHGYAEAKAVTESSKNTGIGNAILDTAADHGSDLIVMGLYGHSRAREWMLGGASREMLASMTVPVLFSH